MGITDLPAWFAYLIVGIFGVCVGSFLNVCIYRLPLGRSVVAPRSHCPRCHEQISWYDNIPLLSYIILQGQCRHCKGKISPRYVVVEILACILSLGTYYHFQNIAEYLIYFCFLVAPLLVVTFIDLEHRLIPDVISLPGIVAGAMARLAFMQGSTLTPVLVDIILGILVGGGFLCMVGLIYELIKKQEGLGGGDVKLACMLGAFFGWKAVIFILLVSSMLGSIVGLFLIFVLKKGLKYAMPFGPFIVAAAYIYLFWGQKILDWYLGLF